MREGLGDYGSAELAYGVHFLEYLSCHEVMRSC